jgi:hypothetical protein
MAFSFLLFEHDLGYEIGGVPQRVRMVLRRAFTDPAPP